MIDDLRAALRDLLPLRIDNIEWNEPTATLVGQEVTAVTRQGCVGPAIDPAFHITGGLCLEIFSDTDWDPWVLRLPTVTFVGSASTPPEVEPPGPIA